MRPFAYNGGATSQSEHFEAASPEAGL